MVEGAAAQSATTREFQAPVGQAFARKKRRQWLAVAAGGPVASSRWW